MSKIVKLQMDHPRFPRRVYLARSLDDVRRLFPNAFFFYQIKWDKFAPLRDAQALSNLLALESKTNTWEGFFALVYPWTIVPFNSTPSPNGNKRQIIRNELGKVLVRARTHTPWNSQTTEITMADTPGSLLLEASERMSVKLNGEMFNTPCEMCANLFAHISGNCDIRVHEKTRANFCHMKLLWESDSMVTPDEAQYAPKLPVIMAAQ